MSNKWAEVSALAGLIREHVPIEDVIREWVPLEQRGQDWVGACPLCGCANGCLVVTPRLRYFYCYGCQASGNVIAFIQQIDSVVFPEAVRRLSERLPTLH